MKFTKLLWSAAAAIAMSAAFMAPSGAYASSDGDPDVITISGAGPQGRWFKEASLFGNSDSDVGTFFADDFVIGVDSVVTDLEWWGIFADGSAAIPSGVTFLFDIFADSSSLPGALIVTDGTFSSVSTVDSGAVAGLSSSSPLLIFSGALTSSAPLLADTYWLSIHAVGTSSTDPVSTFGWTTVFPVPTDGNLRATTTHGSGFGGASEAGFAFDVIGFENSDAVVPEPTSIALLGMGAFGFFGYGWRRRKRGTDVAT